MQGRNQSPRKVDSEHLVTFKQTVSYTWFAFRQLQLEQIHTKWELIDYRFPKTISNHKSHNLI